MNKILKLIIGLIILSISLILLLFGYYLYQLTPITNDNTIIEVDIPKGSSGGEVAAILKDKNLIRDVTIFKIYLKVHKVNNMDYGIYKLSKSMGVEKLVDIISTGKSVNKDIEVLFKEGLNMRGIAKAIATNTNNSEKDVFDLLKDDQYIDSLISQYWFLDDVIKDNGIYYPLEGYLAPNTYRFASKDVTVKDIFKRMLDQTNTILTPLKEDIENADFTVHEFVTLASIVESEGVNDEDRAKIASVFYNRLDDNWSLGSCVTTCYAMKIDVCLSTKVKTDYASPYNTYLTSMAGKLPIGPVSNPGANAIEATANPDDTNYYYFLSDKNKKTYFSKTSTEHRAKKDELQAAGLWLTD